jgi:hypothetical protein
MSKWAGLVAPWAERAAHVFTETSPYEVPTPTRLTQRNWTSTETNPDRPAAKAEGTLRVARGCAGCGTPVPGRRKLCDTCLVEAKVCSAAKARDRSQATRLKPKTMDEDQPTWSPMVNESRGDRMRQQKAERDAWEAGHSRESWAAADFERVRLALAHTPISVITAVTGMSRSACTSIRTGREPCHPRTGQRWPP